jgi:predicted CXXCH cytochrome family protein
MFFQRLLRSTLSILAAVAILGSTDAFAQSGSVVGTKHNLSVSGPGPVKALDETRICIFCHTPHRAETAGPLWNRQTSQSTYLTYQSSTLEASPGQPTGASKLCLSCHDGTIALGLLVSEPTQIPMTSQTPTGRALIGTDLRDDHPVSFLFDAGLAASDPWLVDPTGDPHIVLDENGFLQCTSCHDAHDDSFGHFLREDNRNGTLCLRCHQPTQWANASHATSTATWDGTPPDPWPNTDWTTVADNACENCHTPHGAGHPARLLAESVEEQNCFKCHNGHVAANVEGDFAKISTHPVDAFSGIHDPREDPSTMTKHVECVDCHDPHQANGSGGSAPAVRGPTQGVSGVDASGNPVAEAAQEYQICFKCHAGQHAANPRVNRQHQQTNVRLEFDPSNPSYHPIEAPGKNSYVPSLLPPYTTSSVIYCTDCHSSDTGVQAGGNGPDGPHGSNWEPILERRFEWTDGLRESQNLYALCYKCHDRNSILSNQSFKEHRKHIEGEKASCATCHDPHGVSSTQGDPTHNAHLINFNTDVVQPSNSGKLYFEDLGTRKGRCYLRCHGKDHNPKGY